jgi:hypothetical protein
MAKIKGSQYIQKYNFLPPGYNANSDIEDIAPTAQRSGGYLFQPGGSSSALTPSQIYERNVEQARKSASQKAGLDQYGAARNKARDAYSGYQLKDLTSVFEEAAKKLGLTEISSQIASFQGMANKQKRVLEDLPDTIREGAEDVGISQGQLDLRSAVESRPLIRNISDLLSSVSVLSDQYARGMDQARFSTQLTGQQDQAQLSKLGTAYNMANDDYGVANDMFGTLFSSMRDGITTPQQQAALDAQAKAAADEAEYRKSALAQDESQFSRTLSEQQRQFNNPRRTGGPGGGDKSGPGAFYEEADVLYGRLQKGETTWGNAWNYLKAKYPSMTNAQIDDALGKAAATTPAASAPRQSSVPARPRNWQSQKPNFGSPNMSLPNFSNLFKF